MQSEKIYGRSSKEICFLTIKRKELACGKLVCIKIILDED
jgi:hypothetical protein